MLGGGVKGNFYNLIYFEKKEIFKKGICFRLNENGMNK